MPIQYLPLDSCTSASTMTLLLAAARPLHYLRYEPCHLVALLPAENFLARRRVFTAFRRRHAIHHGRASANFNVSLPIFDWLFGTLRDK